MNRKIIPAVTLAAMLAASGAAIVSAQTATTDETTTAQAVEAPATEAVIAADNQVARTGFFGGRGGDEGRGGHGGRGNHGGGDIVRGILSQADADANGAVTQAEVDAFRAAQVEAADTSGEGNLSLDEFETVYVELIRSQMVDAFQNLDEDGDASVTPAELDARLNGLVEQMDQDGDGALSPADGRGGRD